MSAKMMTVNSKPNQSKAMARSPTGCGSNMPAFLATRMSPQKVCARQTLPQGSKNFVLSVPAKSVPQVEKRETLIEGRIGAINPMSVLVSPGDTSALTSGDLQALHKAKNSGSGSPVSTDMEPGDSSEYSSSDSERPALQSTKSGECSPVSTPTEPGSWDGASSSIDPDEIDQALVDKLLCATVKRAERVLKEAGDSIDPSLATGLQQYIKTAKARQEGAAKKDDVLAMNEYAALQSLLISISSQKSHEETPASTPSTNAAQWPLSVNASDSEGSNSSTPLETQFGKSQATSTCTPPETEVDKSRASSRMHFQASRCEDEPDFLGLGSPGNGSEVFLHVYEVGMLAPTIHKVLATMGTGAYHVGVEVYGREFSYGKSDSQSDASRTGVSTQQPCKHPSHQYCGTVSLGQTKLSPNQLRELIEELKVHWPAGKYHALRNNCVSFAEVLCDRLGVSPPPEHVGSLAKGLKDFWF